MQQSDRPWYVRAWVWQRKNAQSLMLYVALVVGFSSGVADWSQPTVEVVNTCVVQQVK